MLIKGAELTQVTFLLWADEGQCVAQVCSLRSDRIVVFEKVSRVRLWTGLAVHGGQLHESDTNQDVERNRALGNAVSACYDAA